jgi:putative membrane protein
VIITSVRNLTRVFLAIGTPPNPEPTPAELAETEQAVKYLVAILFATKNHLRADWGASAGQLSGRPAHDNEIQNPEYADLIPHGLIGLDHRGLGIPLQFTVLVERYIKRTADRGWFSAPLATQLTTQLNTLVDAYGAMETIRLTPVPVAHL